MRKNKTDYKALYDTLYEDYFTELTHNRLTNDLYQLLTKFPESFTFMGVTYYKEAEVASDPWKGCACGSSSTCGTTFTTDKSGVTTEATKYPEGRYTVLIKREQ